MERNADNFGRESFGRPEALEKRGRKIHGNNLLEEFAETFVGNSPKIRQTQFRNSPRIRSAEPRDQFLSVPKRTKLHEILAIVAPDLVHGDMEGEAIRDCGCKIPLAARGFLGRSLAANFFDPS